MLDKIGLPAKPSLRGNTWVVDCSHCQGCSSQFTFINRKHHCRRCGGLFCNSCTQQRMLLRGQGDSPVRICDPCKKLEQAARFERYGHKSRAGRGSSKLTSNHDDEVLDEILGSDRKELGQESNSNMVSSMQRAASSASSSSSQQNSSHDGVGEIHRSLSVDEPNLQSGGGSASPDELRQQALEEKKKYKVLKGEGKSAEALRAFKRGKELERQADTLETSLRKERRKVLLSANVVESQIKDGPSESGRRNKVTPPVGKEKDDLSTELKELGWSDMDLLDENKKQASLSLEGELSSLLGEVSQKTNKNKGTGAIDKTQVVALKKKALMLKREGKLTEAKEELKRAKILEKELEEQEFLAEAEDSDDELSALIRSMDDDKQEEFSIQYEQEDGFNFDHLISAADDLDGHFEVTDEDMEDPEISAALQSLGWSQDSNNPETSPQIPSVDREALLSEIQSLKREALNHKRAGNVQQAMTLLKKAKLLERDLESLESQEGNVANDPARIHKQAADKSLQSPMVGDIHTMEPTDSKPARKTKLMIQKELLGLKKKALALRREGRLNEAEEELKKGMVLEQELEELENGSMRKEMPGTVGSKVPVLAHELPNVSAGLPVADEEGENVTDQDMHDPAYLSMLKNLGWNDEENEGTNSSLETSKRMDSLSMKVSEPAVTQAAVNVPAGGSRRSKGEIQRELLGLKRKALALRCQGETEDAEELLKKAKALEGQMLEMEAPKENIIEPPLNSAEEERDGGDVTESSMPDPALISEGTYSYKPAVSAPRNKGAIQRELLDLKRKALAFRQKGETKEAEEVLRMAKVLEIQIEEMEAPRDLSLHDDSKEEKSESFGYLINTEKPGNLKDDTDVRRFTEAAMGPIDDVVKLSAKNSEFVPLTTQLAKGSQPFPVELGALCETYFPDDQKIAEGFSQISTPVQSGNLVDLLTGDDWRSYQRPAEKQDDGLKFVSVGSFTASPPVQLGSQTCSNVYLGSQDDKIDKQEDKRDVNVANSVQEAASQSSQSAIRQEILAFKRRALALKREGKLTEAREELRQAKLLEKRLDEDSPQSKTASSEVSSAVQNTTGEQSQSQSFQSRDIPSSSQKHHGSPSSDPKPLSSRDRFKLQQESLGHKRQAMKLRIHSRIQFTLAFTLSSFLRRLQVRRRKADMADTLSALRSLMASHSPPLDALVVPSEDYHQSEYVSARDKRREFVSGFTGSAGLALITKNEARLWTDGRYFLQATQELSDQWQLMRMGEDPTVDVWMADNLPQESAIGIDPWCVSINTAQLWERAFAKKQQKLVQTNTNFVDEVWKNQPPAEINPVIVHPLEYAGRSVADKLKCLREKIVQENARGIIISALDEVAWAYNIRGTDVAYNPVVHAFAIVTSNSAFLYVDKRKVSSEVHSYLEENGIEVREYKAVSSDVALLSSNQLKPSSTVKGTEAEKPNGGNKAEETDNDLIWADPGSCCYALYSRLNPEKVILQPSPLALAKALKNPVELEGLKKAHIRDGVAVVQYLVWLDKQAQEIYGASGFFLEGEATDKKNQTKTAKLTEVTVSDKLEGFRASKENFRGLSFPTISSVGPNAAIIHYSPEAETCAEFDPDSIYLFDSGAQYLDGTTDITRTVHFGKPSAHEKACYTAVLKGHIGLGTARFPNGTNGNALDILARVPLWKSGLDYRHGTGHGVGSYLNVHEGPHLISFRPHARNVPLQVSMTVTDEPGYYEDGKFGIRLENVLVINKADTKFNFGDKGYLQFEHITWAPYQRKLIDLSLLVPEELEWINTYHSKCRDILAPYLDESEKAWLKKATEPISV